ncbi:hypothetical protein [Streptomyces sp. NPDC057002]|uniref:hypothetical protein n=1 Tax=Streptomyces sp. NPDC057002 TaxID=3345992 RepID=UPI0036261FD2
MKQTEPDFWVLEYVTITKDPRTDLVVAIGGTEQAADILQQAGGFLTAPGPRGDYHRLPHGLPLEQQRRKATAASYALLATGHSVHLDPALNTLATPDAERDATLHYLARLAERASDAETSSEVAEVLTEIAAPVHGLLPLTREVVVRAWIAAGGLQGAAPGEEPEPPTQLGDTANSLSRTAYLILLARNHAAHAAHRHEAALVPPGPALPPATPAARRR